MKLFVYATIIFSLINQSHAFMRHNDNFAVDSVKEEYQVNLSYSMDSFIIAKATEIFEFPGEKIDTISFKSTNASTLEMQINRSVNCPAGFLCPMYMPAPIIAPLNITNQYSNTCNQNIIEAQGILPNNKGVMIPFHVVIFDNGAATCRFAYQVMARVYEQSSNGLDAVSQLQGQILFN